LPVIPAGRVPSSDPESAYIFMFLAGFWTNVCVAKTCLQLCDVVNSAAGKVHGHHIHRGMLLDPTYGRASPQAIDRWGREALSSSTKSGPKTSCVLYFRRADTERERSKGSVRGSVRVTADNRHPRQGKPLLWSHHLSCLHGIYSVTGKSNHPRGQPLVTRRQASSEPATRTNDINECKILSKNEQRACTIRCLSLVAKGGLVIVTSNRHARSVAYHWLLREAW
jgi:hypothetical protein